MKYNVFLAGMLLTGATTMVCSQKGKSQKSRQSTPKVKESPKVQPKLAIPRIHENNPDAASKRKLFQV